MNSILLLCICAILVACHAERILFDCGNGAATPTISVMHPYKFDSRHINDTRYSIHLDLVSKFVTKCEAFYNLEYHKYEDFKDLNSTISVFDNVGTYINFFVQDYDIYASEEFNGHYSIVHAGEVYAEKQIDVLLHDFNNFTKVDISCETLRNSNDDACKRNNRTDSNDISCKNDTLNKKETQISCVKWHIDPRDKDQIAEKIPTYVRGSKIMSETLTEHFPDLLDFVTSLDFSGDKVISRETCLPKPDNVIDLNVVLVCLRDIKSFSKPYSRNLRFVLALTDECENKIETYKDILLAVLAPAPFETEGVLVPTIFYKTPFMNPEYYSNFPNSFNLVSGEFLPRAFIKFIKEFEWRRVAIISDDTPYSHEFEEDLLELFNKEGIIHNVQRCGRKCDFEKALNTLKHMDARIVVANVDETNAKRIGRAVKHYPGQFTMLYRVHLPQNMVRDKQSAISITLGPETLDYGSCNAVKENNVPDYTAILNGINVIVHTHNAIVDLFDYIKIPNMSRKKYYRLFTEEAMRNNVNRGFIAYVTRTTNVKDVMWTMKMDTFGIIKNDDILKVHNPFSNIPVAEIPCYTKTNNFAKPCDISLSLLFMFVVIAFCITILIISCYFDNTSPIHGGRYRQL